MTFAFTPLKVTSVAPASLVPVIDTPFPTTADVGSNFVIFGLGVEADAGSAETPQTATDTRPARRILRPILIPPATLHPARFASSFHGTIQHVNHVSKRECVATSNEPTLTRYVQPLGGGLDGAEAWRVERSRQTKPDTTGCPGSGP